MLAFASIHERSGKKGLTSETRDTKKNQSQRMKKEFVVEVISLIIFTLSELAVFVTNGVGSRLRHNRYVLNGTGGISSKYDTQVSAF